MPAGVMLVSSRLTSHHAVRFGDQHHDALEAAAGRHRILHDGVHRHFLHHIVRADFGVVVGACPVALLQIDRAAQLNRPVGAGRVDVERRLAIEPVVRAATGPSARG